MSATINCPICGQQHRSTAKFCPSTGKLIPAAPPPIPLSPGVTGMLPPNSILKNRYLIVGKIAQGGMSAVYRATDTHQPGVVWAIKEMSDAAFTDPEEREYALQSFRQEADLLQKLSHPNLPIVVEFFTDRGKHYFVMEYVPGKTLQDLMDEQQAPFTVDEVMPWLKQICAVLTYLHSLQPKIIFRDLKPSNIMVTPDGHVKLIDFGIVRFFKPGKIKDTLALGTPGYSAPEASSGQTDERSDIYSLCVTIHQLLTGHDPSSAIFNLPTARSLNTSIPPQLDRIINKGLRLERSHRWASVNELVTAVEAVPTAPLIQSGGQVAVSPAQVSVSRPTTRLIQYAVELSNTQIALILGTLVVAVTVATWFLTRQFMGVDFPFDRFPIFAIFGAFGYAALPRRFSALAAHTLLTTAVVGTMWLAQGFYAGYLIEQLLVPVLISGLALEIWVALIDRVKGPGSSQETWRRELFWLVAMAVLGVFVFFTFSPNYRLAGAIDPIRLILAAVFGGLGWFIGDSIQQFILYRQTGFRKRS